MAENELTKVQSGDLTDEQLASLAVQLTEGVKLAYEPITSDMRRKAIELISQRRSILLPAEISEEHAKMFKNAEVNFYAMHNLIAENKLYGLSVNGKVVAVAEIRFFENAQLEKPIFEIGKISVLPRHEGRGIGSDLIQKMVLEIKQQHKDVFVCMQSRNPAIQEWCDKRHWDNVPYNRVCDEIYNDPEIERDTIMEWSSRDGWQFRMARIDDVLTTK